MKYKKLVLFVLHKCRVFILSNVNIEFEKYM